MEHYPDRYSCVVTVIAVPTKNKNMSGNTGIPVFASAKIEELNYAPNVAVVKALKLKENYL